MVSLRRRRLLGLCSGKGFFVSPLPVFPDNLTAPENSYLNAKPISEHTLPADGLNQPQEKTAAKVGSGSSSVSGSALLTEQPYQSISDQPIKRRKRHRRKQIQNQEPCLMRGVYFKNMKWQAAIKVDKKQIHLGTVSSQEEAAHLYDRAAFMCGREPNFELSEEEKQELRKFNWDEFLAFTRRAITNKKFKRRTIPGAKKPSQSGEDSSGLEEVGPDSSSS